jgi:hypothetical protein
VVGRCSGSECGGENEGADMGGLGFEYGEVPHEAGECTAGVRAGESHQGGKFRARLTPGVGDGGGARDGVGSAARDMIATAAVTGVGLAYRANIDGACRGGCQAGVRGGGIGGHAHSGRDNRVALRMTNPPPPCALCAGGADSSFEEVCGQREARAGSRVHTGPAPRGPGPAPHAADAADPATASAYGFSATVRHRHASELTRYHT